MSHQSDPRSEETLGALVHQLSEQVPQLVRSEIRLAQAELAQKGKQAGIGIGLFSVAAVLAYFGLAVLIATAIIALALVLPWWVSALTIGVVLLLVAGAAALAGKGKVQQATPAKPQRAIDGIKEDVATVKGQRA